MVSMTCLRCRTKIEEGNPFCVGCGSPVVIDTTGVTNYSSVSFEYSLPSEARRFNRNFIIRSVFIASLTLLAEGIIWGLLSGLPDWTGPLASTLFVVISIGMLVVTAASAMVLKNWLKSPAGNAASWVISLVAWFVFVNIGKTVGEMIVG